MAAISEGLATALSQIRLVGNDQRKSDPKVIIFTDFKEAMNQIDGFRCTCLTKRRLRSDHIGCKLVTRSQ